MGLETGVDEPRGRNREGERGLNGGGTRRNVQGFKKGERESIDYFS